MSASEFRPELVIIGQLLYALWKLDIFDPYRHYGITSGTSGEWVNYASRHTKSKILRP